MTRIDAIAEGRPRAPRPACRSSCPASTRPPAAAPARTAGRDRAASCKRRAACAAKSSMSTTASATTHLRSRSALPATALDVQVISLSRNFGKEAALLAGLEHARYGALLFMDGDGQHPPDSDRASWSAIGSMTATTWSTPPRRIARTNRWSRRFGVKTFYALINFRARHKIPEDAGDFRLLSPRAAAACGRCRSATASSRGWRAGSASGRCASITSRPSARMADQLELCSLIGALDRGADLVLGRAAAAREPARPRACRSSR